MNAYPLTVASLLLALLAYLYATIAVGRGRAKYKVAAPATTGHPDFDRIFRAHQNTVEQFVFFVPLLALAALMWGDRIAALYGLIWSVGRFLYVVTYAQAADKRSIGFFLSGVLSMLVLVALIVTWAMRALGNH